MRELIIIIVKVCQCMMRVLSSMSNACYFGAVTPRRAISHALAHFLPPSKAKGIVNRNHRATTALPLTAKPSLSKVNDHGR